MEAFVKTCMAEFKVKGSLLIDAYTETLKPEDVPMKLKCAMECYLKKLDLYDSATDKFSFEKAREKFTDVVNTCEGTVGIDKCDTAYQLVTCFWKHIFDSSFN